MAIDIEALLSDVKSSEAGGTFAAYLGDGNTVILPVRDTRIDEGDIANGAGLFGKAKSVFVKDGKPQESKKYIIFAVVLSADNPKGLSKGWDGNWEEAHDSVKERAKSISAQRVLVPLSVPKKVLEAYLNAIGSAVETVDVDFETGAVTVVDGAFPLVINRSGKGLTTSYSVTPLMKLSAPMKAAIASIKTVVTPETTIIDIAADYSAFQAKRAEEQLATPQATPSKGNDLADAFNL